MYYRENEFLEGCGVVTVNEAGRDSKRMSDWVHELNARSHRIDSISTRSIE